MPPYSLLGEPKNKSKIQITHPWTPEEISGAWGLTKEGIGRSEEEAFKKLQRKVRINGRRSQSTTTINREVYMIVYRFYLRDAMKGDIFLGALPERRKNPKRITNESVINWGRKYFGMNGNGGDIFS
ncbi:MAG: hypothetical protein ACXU9W_14000 [Thermodesulfobacteriota bacterium]